MTRSELLARKPWMDVTIRAALIGAAVLVYLDLKAEIRYVRVDLGNRMDRMESRMDRIETRIDRLEVKVGRLETKIDEVRGYLKFDMTAPNEDPSPPDMKE